MEVEGQARGRAKVFVVGSGRCGSTLFSNVVRLHPDLLSVSEFLSTLITRNFVLKALDGEAFWRLLTQDSPTGRIAMSQEAIPREFLYEFGPKARFTKDNLPAILKVTLPHMTDDPDALYFELESVVRRRPKAPVAEQYNYLFSWLCDRFGKKIWVERSGASLIYLPALVEHFPEAKFVHVIRDGRDVAMSVQDHAAIRLLAEIWSDSRFFGIDLMRPPFLIGSSRALTALEPLLGLILRVEKAIRPPPPPPLHRLGDFWSRLVEVGTATFQALPESQRLVVAYEDLVADPRRELTRFIDFVDPALRDEAWLEASVKLPKHRPSKWRGLPDPERSALEAACAPGLRLLGYAT